MCRTPTSMAASRLRIQPASSASPAHLPLTSCSARITRGARLNRSTSPTTFPPARSIPTPSPRRGEGRSVHMFDEPTEPGGERSSKPSDRAKEKSDEFRMHAELAAVFEGTRKFDAQIIPTLDPEIARQAQRMIGRLEKSKTENIPLLPESSAVDAAALLNLHETKDLSTNDYHLHRRPGEVMILRWLEGEQVDWFYERLQAHFDAALAAHKDDQQQSHGWKQDADAEAYLEALEKIDL